MGSHRCRRAVPAVVLLAATLACGGTVDPVPAVSPGQIGIPEEFAGRTVDVAIYENFPPAAFIENGELVGFVVDLTLALEEKLAIDFDIDRVHTFDTIIPGLQSGRYDVAPDLYYITPGRLAVVDLITMSKVGGAFITTSVAEVTIRSMEDLCGLTSSTVNGYVFAEELKEMSVQCEAAGHPEIHVQTFPNNSTGIFAVTTGRADLFVGSTDEVEYIVSTTEGLKRHPFVYRERLEATAVPKGSALAEPIRAGFDALIADGNYGAILERWGVSEMAIEASEINPVERTD